MYTEKNVERITYLKLLKKTEKASSLKARVWCLNQAKFEEMIQNNYELKWFLLMKKEIYRSARIASRFYWSESSEVICNPVLNIWKVWDDERHTSQKYGITGWKPWNLWKTYLGRCPDLPRYPDNKAARAIPTLIAQHAPRTLAPCTPHTRPTAHARL